MNIAIPVWEEKVSPVFDTATRLRILQVKDRQEVSRFESIIEEQEFSRRCSRIRDLSVDLLICGAISRQFYRKLTSSGVRVIPWISGRAEEVLEAYLEGNLFCAKFLMPGCRWKSLNGESESAE
jgi:predicted Fe-Mo cluster-binding NifX family protein